MIEPFFVSPDANKPLETIYISNKQFEDILRKLLLIKQYRVEIWKKSQKSSNDWALAYHVGFNKNLEYKSYIYHI